MRGNKESNLSDCPNEISYECTKKIIEQMEKDICIIKIDDIQGTGFFTKIPFPDLNNMLPVLITNHHIINKALLNANNKKISIRIKQDNFYKTLYLNNRIKYSQENYDITIIEIKDEDEINNYLDLDDIIIDDILNNNNTNVEYMDKTIYIIHYPKSELSVSYGVLKNIYQDKKFHFKHRCSTEPGSSGSPIFNLKNKVLGYHKDGLSSNNYNLGAFLNYPLKEFIKLKCKIKQKSDEVSQKSENDHNKNIILSGFKNLNNENKLSISENHKINKVSNKNKNKVSIKNAKTSNKKKETLFIDFRNISVKNLNSISKKDDNKQKDKARNTINSPNNFSKNYIKSINLVENNLLNQPKKSLHLENKLLNSSKNKPQYIFNENIIIQNEPEDPQLGQLQQSIKQSLININIQSSKKKDINNNIKDNLLINNNLKLSSNESNFNILEPNNEEFQIFPLEVRNTYQNNIDNTSIIKMLRENSIKGFKTYGEISKKGDQKDKSNNQDIDIIRLNIGNIKGFNLFGVLDGHGPDGHLISKFCKKYFIETLDEYTLSCIHNKISTPEEIYNNLKNSNFIFIKQLFKNVEDEIKQIKNINSYLSGTTCTLVFQFNQFLVCSNVGNSRAILIYDNDNIIYPEQKIIQLSIDHLPDLPQEKERILYFGGRVDYFDDDKGTFRVFKNGFDYPGFKLSRTLCYFQAKECECGVISEPQITEFKLDINSKYMVICSDGVWDVYTNEEIRDFANPFYIENDVLLFVRSLYQGAVSKCKEKDTYIDDITVVCVYF